MKQAKKKQVILDYMKKHPKATMSEVSEATKTSYSYVHRVISGKPKTTKKKVAKKKVPDVPQIVAPEIEPQKRGFWARLFGMGND